MNVNCNGDWFPTLGLYRCLYDGKFLKYKNKPTICRDCKRAVNASIVKKPKFKTSIIETVKVKTRIGWVTMKETRRL